MRRMRVGLMAVAVLLGGAAAWGVRPATFSHETEQEFAEGAQFDNTVINNYGELTLGREIRPIEIKETSEMVVGIVTGRHGASFVATGPDGKVLRVAHGKAEAFFEASAKDGAITAIGMAGVEGQELKDASGKRRFAPGDVLLATSDGKRAKLLKLDDTDGKQKAGKLFFEKDGVENIWAICPTADGAVLLGTGPKGQVYRVEESGESSVVLDGAGKNVMAVMLDKKNRIIAGTDGNGLVIRVGEDKKGFVLHEAGEGVDITSLAMDDEGNIFAGAAKSDEPPDMDLPEDDLGSKSKPDVVEPEGVVMPDEDVPGPKEKITPPAPPPAKVKPPKIDMPPMTMPKKPAVRDGDTGMLPRHAGTYFADFFSAGSVPKKNAKLPPPATKKKPAKGLPPGAKKLPPRPGLGKIDLIPDSEPDNAVYKIAPDGSVSTIFSGEDMVMSLLWHKGSGAHGGELLIGTGTDGKIFAYSPEDESETLVARVKEESVTALAEDKTGAVLVGASDLGQVYTLAPGLAAKGTYTSKVLDAARPAVFGSARVAARVPKGAAVTIATRTGNVGDIANQEKFWSPWSEEMGVNETSGKIASPSARYIQYRVTLTGDGKELSGMVESVKISYAVKNLPPQIKNLTVTCDDASGTDDEKSAESAPPDSTATVDWDATDPNHDTLVFRLYYKQADAGETWTPIVKDLKDSTYEWSTRSLPDGKYQVKVVASDSPDNLVEEAKSVARVSAPFIIDHTAPELGELKAESDGGKLTVSGSAKDALSAVTDVRYQVDGAEDWQPAKPSGKIFDSLSEAFTLTTRQFSPGGHRITVRATDAAGNAAFKAVSVTVK